MESCSEKCPYDTHCDGKNCQRPDMQINNSPNAPEPAPVKNNHPAVWDLVLADMKERDSIGKEKYNTRLQPFNGRDPLIDLYQEILDAAVYIRQIIYERDMMVNGGKNED